MNRDTKKRRLAKRGAAANIVNNSKSLVSKEQKKVNIDARTVQKTEINPKYNKNNLYIWKQHGVPEKKLR